MSLDHEENNDQRNAKKLKTKVERKSKFNQSNHRSIHHRNDAEEDSTQATSQTTTPFVIAIVGTGPSGLSAALALQQTFLLASLPNNSSTTCNNMLRRNNSTHPQPQQQQQQEQQNCPTNVRIHRLNRISRNIVLHLYERDVHFSQRKEGYGLTLTYNPHESGPLANLQVLEQVAQEDCPSRSHYVFHSNGSILGYYGRYFSHPHRMDNIYPNHSSSFSSSSSSCSSSIPCTTNPTAVVGGGAQRGNLRVPRQVLRKILLDELLHRNQIYMNCLSTNDNEKDDHEEEEEEPEREEIKQEQEITTTRPTSTLNPVHIFWGKRFLSYDCNPMYIQKNQNLRHDHTMSHHQPMPKPITMYFEDGSTATADLLIGADGVRSKVVQSLLYPHYTSKNQNPALSTTDSVHKHMDTSTSDLSYLGIMIVLGITDHFFHPLLDERGFYTVDGTHRLFTMPYEGSLLNDIELFGTSTKLPSFVPTTDTTMMTTSSSSTGHHSNNSNVSSLLPRQHKRRFMWQLSFQLEDESKAKELSKLDASALLDHVLQRVQGWHEPVEEMMRSTPLDTVWGTPLMDRNPKYVHDQLNAIYHKSDTHKKLRTVVMGDAIHAMSPFKGQGCNQALMDGPLLASWLSQSSLDSAIRGFMREMVQRTSVKVQASRQAASFYHSEAVLTQVEDFAGVKNDRVPDLLRVLQERGIGAHLGGQIDASVAQVIHELNAAAPRETTIPLQESLISDFEQAALDMARRGDTGGLRKLSLKYPDIIRCARSRDGADETCLHLAAKSGHYYTCKWLLADAAMPFDILDSNRRSPLHAATLSGDERTIKLLYTVSSNCNCCWLQDCDGKTPNDVMEGNLRLSKLSKTLRNLIQG